MDFVDIDDKTNSSSRKFIYTAVLICAVLPEYIAPVLTLAGFVVFKKRFSLTKNKVKMGDVGKVFLLFMCYSLLSSFWSATPVFSAAVSLLWMGMLLGSFMISNLTVREKELNSLVFAFSLGGGIVGSIGIVQYILILLKIPGLNPFWRIFDVLIYKIMPFSITDTAHVWESSRAASTFDNPLICATYLVLVLPIAVYGFISGEKKHRKVCGICAILIICGIAATNSRGPALAVIASLIVLLFLNSKKALSIAVTIIASAGVFVLAILKRDRLFEFDLEKSTDSRIKMWKACRDLITKKPVFGYGAGCENTSAGMKDYGINKPHAHSLYIEMTTELGFVGIIFLAVVFGFIIFDIVKLIKAGGKYTKLGITFLSVLVGFGVASMTEFTMQTPKELQYFMFILGMLEAAKRLCIKENLSKSENRETIAAGK